MIFVDFVVLRENFWFLPPKIRSRRHVGAGWFLTTALVGMLLSQNTSGLPIEQILQLPNAEFENLVEPSRRTCMLYIEPDGELVLRRKRKFPL